MVDFAPPRMRFWMASSMTMRLACCSLRGVNSLRRSSPRSTTLLLLASASAGSSGTGSRTAAGQAWSAAWRCAKQVCMRQCGQVTGTASFTPQSRTPHACTRTLRSGAGRGQPCWMCCSTLALTSEDTDARRGTTWLHSGHCRGGGRPLARGGGEEGEGACVRWGRQRRAGVLQGSCVRPTGSVRRSRLHCSSRTWWEDSPEERGREGGKMSVCTRAIRSNSSSRRSRSRGKGVLLL